MVERVAFVSSSVPDTPALRRSAAVPHLSNAGLQRLLRGTSPPRRPRTPGVDARPGPAVAALQRAVAARRALARDPDQDPGPPELPDPQGFTCGIKDGKPYCTVSTGKGDALELDSSALTPDAPDPKRPKSCPPERWNWMWETCCPPGKHFDASTKSCREDLKEQPFDIPPAPAQDWGDFPLPDDGQAYG
jgi:hypothetical protein